MPVTEEQIFPCPYCGSDNSVLVDFTAGARQEYVSDCEVCCRPIAISLRIAGTAVVEFRAAPE